MIVHTQQGEIRRHERVSYGAFLRLTVPFMISTATQPLLGAVNTAIMGHMDSAAYIAAVSLGVILFNSMYWLFGFLRVATTGFSAQALGRGDSREVSLALYRPATLAALIGALCLLAYPWLIDGYASFMKADPTVSALLRQYTDILIWGAPLVLGNYVILGWLMGQMLVRLTLWVQMSMNVLNMLLSFGLVFYGHMGVEGVAWGTLIAQLYGFLCGVGAVLTVKKRLLWSPSVRRAVVSGGDLLRIMKVNTDLMIRTVCLLTINNVFANTGSAMGTATLAGNAVLLEIIFIMAYFFDGIANGVSVFGGRAKGDGDGVLWRDTIRIGLVCGAAFTALLEVLLIGGGTALIHGMTDVAAVRQTALTYHMFLYIYPLCAGTGLVLYGLYTGTGETAAVRNMMLIAVIVFYAGHMWLTALWGNTGLWLAYVGTYALESFILTVGLKRAGRSVGGAAVGKAAVL